MFMIASAEWLNPTRAVGLLAYGTAFTCCCISLMKTKTRRVTSHLAAVLLGMEGLLLLDIAFNWRWQLHQAMLELAVRKHEYSERRLPQSVVVSLLVVLLLLGLVLCWRSFRHHGNRLLAVSGALLSVIVWCVEVVSLHAVDHVLYSSVRGVMAVTLLWILACGMTSVGILRDPR